MIFDGIKFRRNQWVVQLRRYEEINGGHYVRFGRIVPEGKPVPPNAEATKRVWPGGEPVIAVPIETTGYSLTNMAYGADGRLYLGYDGMCFTALSKKFKREREAKELARALRG